MDEVRAFPDLTADPRVRAPGLRGRLLANQPLADLTWFRVGGPAQLLFIPEDEDDLCAFPRAFAGGHPGHRHRARLQPHHSGRRRAGRGDPPWPRLRRYQGGSRCAHPRRRRGAGRESGACRPGRRDQRPVVSARHSGCDRRCLAHEWRCLRGRDQGRAHCRHRRGSRRPHLHLFECRHALYLPPLRGAGRRHFHHGPVPGRAGRRRQHQCRDGQDHRKPRGDAADQEPHRRVDVQKSTWAQGLAADRCGGLPRPGSGGRSSLGIALQFPDQPWRRQRGRHRELSGKPSGRASRKPRASISNGRSSASALPAGEPWVVPANRS